MLDAEGHHRQVGGVPRRRRRRAAPPRGRRLANRGRFDDQHAGVVGKEPGGFFSGAAPRGVRVHAADVGAEDLVPEDRRQSISFCCFN